MILPTQIFHKVQALLADRDALRFLWRFSKDSPIDTYKMNSIYLKKQILVARLILKKISPGNLSAKIVNLDLDELPIERALGVSWDPNSDMLTFKVVNKNIPETKRGILSMVSSIFDPMGLISPIIVKAKLLIQEIWRRSLGWDERFPRDLTAEWNL